MSSMCDAAVLMQWSVARRLQLLGCSLSEDAILERERHVA